MGRDLYKRTIQCSIRARCLGYTFTKSQLSAFVFVELVTVLFLSHSLQHLE